MGYTHYWRNSAERIPAEAVMIIRDIVNQAYADHIVQYEHDVARLPVVNETEIRFNGIGENGHETFHFTVHDRTFAFCKTARKPYDEVVMKVLIVLKHFLMYQLVVTSDGSFDEEWAAVRAEMAEAYGLSTSVGEELEVAA